MSDESDELIRRQRAEIMQCYKMVAATPEGNIVFADIIQRFAYHRQSIGVLANFDPVKMQFMEGQRSICIYIGNQIEGVLAQAETAGQPILDDIGEESYVHSENDNAEW